MMSLILKRQNISQKVDSRNFQKRFDDRITNLPSGLKTKILSCLPTKEAVRTSVLSRNWKRSWTSLTNLDFDDKLTMWYRVGQNRDVLEEEFVHVVNRVLLLRERSTLQRFHMRCGGCYKGSLVNTWISAILPCHVQELDLFVPIKNPCLLTSDIFTCKTLTILKLYVDGQVNMPTSVCLPHLKTLHLAKVKLSDDVSIRNLLSGCLLLEELDLRECIGDDVCVVNVIAPGLTNLTLKDLPYKCKRIESDFWFDIILDTPALKVLNMNDYVAKGYVLKNLNHLVKADITVGAPDAEFYPESSEIRSRAITDVLNQISHLQCLVLSRDSTMTLFSCDPVLPIFSNLTSLELST